MNSNKNILSIILAIILTFLSITNIISSEFGLGNTGMRQAFYGSFILLAITMLCYTIFHRGVKIPTIGKICLAISVYWGIKVGLSIHPSNYDILSVEYSFYWTIAIIFGCNYFASIKTNDSTFINLMFYCYILTCVANVFAFLEFQQLGVSIMPLIYNSLTFLPWILLTNNRKKIIGLIVLCFITIISGKRGAIIIMAIESILGGYFIITNNRISLFKKACIICLASGAILYMFNNISDDSEEILVSKFSSEELSEGSGRADINEYGITAVQHMSSTKELLLGYDLGSDILDGFGGHNDWLTYMLYHGILGVTLYLLFYINIINGIIKLYRRGDSTYIPYISLFIIFIILSFISSSYNPTIHPLMGMLFIGYAESKLIYSNETSRNIHIY